MEESPAFRSTYFNLGNGLVKIPPGGTDTLASIATEKYFAGVLTGLSQSFEEDTDKDLISWTLKINGKPVRNFNCFVGEYGSHLLPYPIMTPVPAESQATLEATNYTKEEIVIQGRLIGYRFPTAEH